MAPAAENIARSRNWRMTDAAMLGWLTWANYNKTLQVKLGGHNRLIVVSQSFSAPKSGIYDITDDADLAYERQWKRPAGGRNLWQTLSNNSAGTDYDYEDHQLAYTAIYGCFEQITSRLAQLRI